MLENKNFTLAGLVLLAINFFFVAACSGQEQGNDVVSQDQKGARNYGVDPFLALHLSLEADPGSSVGTVEIRAHANVKIDSVFIRFHSPFPYELEKGYGPETGPSVPLWQGKMEMGQELVFERRVSIVPNTLMQTAVTANFKRLYHDSGAAEDLHFVIKPDTVMSGVLHFVRRAQLAYERRERGLADEAIQEIYEIDPKFAWKLEHPLSDPYRLHPSYVTAEDGEKVEYTAVPRWMLFTLSDAELDKHSAQYALRQYYLRKYGEPQPPSTRNKQVQVLPALPPIKIQWPEELSRDEVPDSLLYVKDDSTWTARERIMAIRETTLELKAWIEAWKKKD